MQLEEIKNKLMKDFGESMDLALIPAEVAGKNAIYCMFEALCDKTLLENSVIKPLSLLEGELNKDNIHKKVFTASPISIEKDLDKIEERICAGETALFIEGAEECFIFPIKKWQHRSVTEPPTSSVIKGPREGFTEDINVNTALLRKRLKNKKLVIQKKIIGRYSGTTVCVCFISGIASQKVIDTINERLSRIDIDGIIDSSYIAKLIEDNRHSFFQQVGSVEKPDVVAAKMLEGRVAIIVEGSPMVLTIPHLLIEDFQDSQDYFKRNARVTIIRFLRLFGALIALFLPAAFVAVQEFQYQVIPLKFLITIVNSTNGTPLSPTLEMILVLLIFDILNEASVRMPRYVGMALSIVGAIVLGETAVSAGLLSSPAVLVTALSSIGLYLIPDDVGTYSLLRLIFVATAALLGLLGIIFSILLLVSHLANLKSFGANYLAPYAPIVTDDLKDGFAKKDIHSMFTRPFSIANENHTRMAEDTVVTDVLKDDENQSDEEENE